MDIYCEHKRVHCDRRRYTRACGVPVCILIWVDKQLVYVYTNVKGMSKRQ
jgi:hypothetical protein